MALQFVILLSALSLIAVAQRPFFAGTKPIGYPIVATTSNNNLGNRYVEVMVHTIIQQEII